MDTVSIVLLVLGIVVSVLTVASGILHFYTNLKTKSLADNLSDLEASVDSAIKTVTTVESVLK